MSLPGFAADWPAPPRIRTWQTVRAGGVSRGSYAGLNLGAHVGDAPAAVAQNRQRLVRDLRLPGEPCWLEQVHGTRIVDADTDATGPADGAVTHCPGRVLVIMTADCLPVLFAARDGSRIAAAHAGWRGLAAGVLEAAIAACGCDPGELMAWLGPAIGQNAFEVGGEVRSAFVDSVPAAATAFVANARGRWQADLPALARLRLRQAGVERIYGSPECTFSNADRYFSHRREAPCGRMASLIWIGDAH